MRTIFVFAILMFATGLISQDIDGKNFSLGPKLGINISDNSASGTKSTTGLVAGLTSTYSINELTGIGIDLLFSGQGFKVGNTKTSLNYIQIPVLYKVFFNRLGNKFRPRIELGLAPAFLISAERNNVDVKNAFNNVDLLFQAGIGFNYRLSSRFWLNVDARSQWGLIDVYDNTASKNNVIGLNVGLAMGI